MGLTVASGTVNAYSQYKSGQEQKKIAGENAELANRAASDAVLRGDRSANEARLQGDQLQGRQMAGYAGGNVDVGIGSSAQVIASTAGLSEYDARTIKNNAAREAWGYKTQGIQYRQQGDLAERQGNFGAVGSLLGAAGGAMSYGSRLYGSLASGNTYVVQPPGYSGAPASFNQDASTWGNVFPGAR